MIKEEIILSGFGGQGLMLLGKIIAQAALLENKFVSWFPSYGAEVRSGTAHCLVVISNREIGSCYIDSPTIAILLNEPSLKKFQGRIKKNGLMILNSSLIKAEPKRKNITIVKMPFTDIASDLGNIKTANMLSLGVLLAKKKIIKLNSVFSALGNTFSKQELYDINRQAVEKGRVLGKKYGKS